MAKVAVFVGTRPEVIKSKPVIEELFSRRRLETILIHTGQHYDWEMSQGLFDELRIRKPDLFLGVGSASQGVQTARVIARSEKALKSVGASLAMVQGDTNSALGVALASAKLRIPVAHVEAGCRSHDPRMTEEMNRVIVSDIAQMQFAPTRNCVTNLLKEGIPKSRIHLTGHPIVDLMLEIRKSIPDQSNLPVAASRKDYYFATLHREENVDDRDTLRSILMGLAQISKDRTLVLSLHPRTSKRIRQFNLQGHLSGIKTVGPVPYRTSLGLIRNSRIVLTDSGGIQQECALLGTPCITLRTTTEWVETIAAGVNFLCHTSEGIVGRVDSIERGYEAFRSRFVKAGGIFGQPGVSKRIVDIIERWQGTERRRS